MTVAELSPILVSVSDKLPFDARMQSAVMGYIMTDRQFFLQCKGVVLKSWFSDNYVGDVFEAYRKFYDAMGRIPNSKSEFTNYEEIALKPNEKKLKLIAKIEVCYQEITSFGLDVIRKEMTSWAKANFYSENIKRFIDLYNGRHLTEAEAFMHEMSRKATSITFEGAKTEVYNLEQLGRDLATNFQDACRFGLTMLDREIIPESPDGCLIKGDTTLIVSPINQGKTTTLITIAFHNVKAGKDVLFVALEGNRVDLMVKTVSCYMDISRGQFMDYCVRRYDEPAINERMIETERAITKHFTFMPVFESGLTVEKLISKIRNEQILKRARDGKGYDLVCIDYPGVLTSSVMSQTSDAPYRVMMEYVYTQLSIYAQEDGFHHISAVQTNREGSRINRNQDRKEEGRLLVMEDVAESFGVNKSASNIITVNRDLRAQNENYLTYYVVKSRTSKQGTAFVCQSSFVNAITHSDALGCTMYQGSHTMPDRIQEYLKKYRNRKIEEFEMYYGKGQ